MNANASSLPWHISEIAYDQIDQGNILHDEPLILTLAAASLVERASDTYTSQLTDYFKDYPEITHWLQTHWEPEEVQHGNALAKYITTIWPDFDWDKTYADFMKEYEPTCSGEYYEKMPALELVSRCIVETGTSSLYYAISHYCKDPILKDLTERIRKDEVRHYKIFLQNFKTITKSVPVTRWQTAQAIYRRLKLIREDDTTMAAKYVLHARYPEANLQMPSIKDIMNKSSQIIQSNLPLDTAMRMALTPLDLPKRLQNWIERPLTAYIRRFTLHPPRA